MSLKTVLVEIEEDAVHALKAISGVLEAVVISAGQVFVAKLKALPIATAAMNTIELLEETGKPGGAKFAELIAKEGPALAGAVHDMGGLAGLFSSVEALGEEFFNSLVNDFKAAGGKAAATS